MEEFKVLLKEELLQERIEELAKQIEHAYAGEEITLICVLKGSTPFMMDLAKHIHNKVKFEFMEVSSYGNGRESSGNIIIKKDVKNSIENENILVIEDIIDSGRTLSFLLEHLKSKNPKSIRLCTLLDKPDRRVMPVKVDFIGFTIPDKFVFGYGLDYDEYYRNIPYIAYIEK